MECPDDINVTISKNKSEVAVTWREPTIGELESDVQPSLTQTKHSGDLFSVGVTKVEYHWHNTSLKCEFLVQVFSNGEHGKHCPRRFFVCVGVCGVYVGVWYMGVWGWGCGVWLCGGVRLLKMINLVHVKLLTIPTYFD